MSWVEHTLQGQVYHKEIQIVDHVQPDIINSIESQNNIQIYKMKRSLIISVFKFNIASTIQHHSTSINILKLLISTNMARGIAITHLTHLISKVYTHDTQNLICENVCACIKQTSKILQLVFLLYIILQMALQGSSLVDQKY